MKTAGFLLVLALALPAGAEEKLQIDLPNVVVTGKGEMTPLKGGAKVLSRPEIHRINLPESSEPRASARLVAQAELPASPSLSLATESLPLPRLQYRELFAGVGNGLDLGFYLGQQWGEHLGVLNGEGQFTPTWSQLALDGLVQLQKVPISARYRRNSQGNSLQEFGTIRTQQTFGGVDGELAGSLGRVLSASTDSMWEMVSRLGYKPNFHADHLSDITGVFGVQATTARLDGLALVALQDRWQFAPQWAMTAGLDLGTNKGLLLADPTLRVSFQPDPKMELSAGALLKTEMPSFEELYLSRFWVQENPQLLPMHRGGLELSLSKYFENDLYVQGVARYGKINRGIVYAEQGGYWKPLNTQVQDAWGFDGALSQSLENRNERLVYRISSYSDTGYLDQRWAFSHDQSWGNWTLSVSPMLTWQRLGAIQTGLGLASGWQALLDCGLSYRLNPSMQFFLAGQDLALVQQQPAPRYFTPASLGSLGIKVRF